MDTDIKMGMREVRDNLGSCEAVGQVLGMTRQGAAKLVARGFVISPTQREHILRLLEACPDVGLAALCGIDEDK